MLSPVPKPMAAAKARAEGGDPGDDQWAASRQAVQPFILSLQAFIVQSRLGELRLRLWTGTSRPARPCPHLDQMTVSAGPGVPVPVCFPSPCYTCRESAESAGSRCYDVSVMCSITKRLAHAGTLRSP